MARQYINIELFKDLLPDGAKFYVRPEMPKIEFKRDGIKYKMSDFRLLHPLGVDAFKICLGAMLNNPDASGCRIECAEALDEETMDVIKDIVMGFSFEAEKGGKHGFMVGSCVVGGVHEEETENGNQVLVFHFSDNFGKYAYEYNQAHKGETIRLEDLVVYAVGRIREEL